MDKLLNCPFCGGKARMWASQTKYNKDGSYEAIGCSNVDCLIEPTTDEYLPYEEATKRWNTRAVPDVPELVRYSNISGWDGMPCEYINEDIDGDYVTYSQAAEIIAAKDAEIYFDASLRITYKSLCETLNEECGKRFKRAEAAEADNKRLRKALESIADWPNGGKNYGQENIKMFARTVIKGQQHDK